MDIFCSNCFSIFWFPVHARAKEVAISQIHPLHNWCTKVHIYQRNQNQKKEFVRGISTTIFFSYTRYLYIVRPTKI